MQGSLGNGRYRLTKDGNEIVIKDEFGLLVMYGSIDRVHELAMVLNRYLLYGETSEAETTSSWLSTGDALAFSQQHRGPGKDAIRRAARNGRFVAEKDASGRWQYERSSFMQWLLDDAAHRPGR